MTLKKTAERNHPLWFLCKRRLPKRFGYRYHANCKKCPSVQLLEESIYVLSKCGPGRSKTVIEQKEAGSLADVAWYKLERAVDDLEQAVEKENSSE